jgi:hypothetical protein
VDAEEICAFEANVSVRVVVGSGRWAGLAARDDVPAKGFGDADVENGFEELENGFKDDPWEAPPNSAAPILDCGVAVSLEEFVVAFEVLLDFDFVILFPRIALTLPSFLLQALRRQLKIYSLLS